MPLRRSKKTYGHLHTMPVMQHLLGVHALLTLPRLMLVSTSLALAACGHSSAPAQQSAPPTEIGYQVITTQSVTLNTELPGRISAYLVAEVRPQVNGIIKDRLFKEGTDVKAGQVLYQIDPSLLQTSYDSSQATLAKDEANQITLKLKAERYKELLDIHGISQQDYDDAYAAMKQGEATIAVDKAALSTNRINLQYARITAPISGRIGISTVTAGALVTASQTNALSTVQQLDPIYVDITQSSTALLKLRRQLEKGELKADRQQSAIVSLQLDDGSRYALPGKLQFSDVSVDQATSSVTLRAVFPNPKHELLPGMYVTAQLEEGQQDNAILVPQTAVTRDTTGAAVVTLLDGTDKLETRRIDAQRMVGKAWLVGSGLQAGDRVVVDGISKLRPGMPFKAVEIPGTQAKLATNTALKTEAGDQATAPQKPAALNQ